MARQLTAATGDRAFFACSTNYLVDLDNAIIVYVAATAPIRQAETGAVQSTIEPAYDRFGLDPETLVADTAYGSPEMLGWQVLIFVGSHFLEQNRSPLLLKVLGERGIEPHIPVFDKSARSDGCLERADFIYDSRTHIYRCPGGKTLVRYRQAGRAANGKPCAEGLLRYRAKKADCQACALKPRCCPKVQMRKVMRHVYEGARGMVRDITAPDAYVASSRARKKGRSRCCLLISSAS